MKDTVVELQKTLSSETYREFRQKVRALMRHPLFHRVEGTTVAEQTSLAYRRAKFLVEAMGLTRHDLAGQLDKLYALHDEIATVDGVACTVLSIHYCLAMGTIFEFGNDREDLEPYLEELEHMRSVGLFLATELGYGNNVQALETRAEYIPERREFEIHTRGPLGVKFWPNSGYATPKLAIVMARLIARGEDCGVFPFIVRVRGASGAPEPGVAIIGLPEKPGYALDNAMTELHGVRAPKAALLCGETSTLHDDGRFESTIPSRRTRFLRAMDRVQSGRVSFTGCSVAGLQAAVWVTYRYLEQRQVAAPRGRLVPAIAFRNVQRDVFSALVDAYALAFATRRVRERYVAQSRTNSTEVFQQVAVLKALASDTVAKHLGALRQRCGASGLLSSNRIIEYWIQVQGIVTAEGDNQLMFMKVGRQLLDDETWAELDASPHEAGLLSVERCAASLRRRVGQLRRALKMTIRRSLRRERNAFSVWNDSVNETIELAISYGELYLAEAFIAAIEVAQHETAKRSLEAAFRLWWLERLERHAAWWMLQGDLSQAEAEELPQIRGRLLSELESRAHDLVEAFELDNDVLRAPIAGHYVEEYAGLAHRGHVAASVGAESGHAETTNSGLGPARPS